MATYSIQLTANLTGLTVHTLRAWEKRYRVVIPGRTPSGHRLYSDEDVQKLKILSDLCSLGHNISALVPLSNEELKELSEKSGVRGEYFNPSPPIRDDIAKARKSLEHLLMALEGYRLDIISHEIYNLKMTCSPRQLALDIVGPLLRQVGQKVVDGQFSVAQEHALSSILKFHLGQFVYRGYEEKRRKTDLYVLATPEGDYHEFGIVLASLLCLHYGVNFFYLGANMPHTALVNSLESIEATHILLGTSLTAQNQPEHYLTDYLSQMIQKIKPETQLIVGGPGFFDTTLFQKKGNFSFFPTLEHLDHHLKEKTKIKS